MIGGFYVINYEELEKLGLDTGFSHIAPLKCSTIELLPEVRQPVSGRHLGTDRGRTGRFHGRGNHDGDRGPA